MFKRVVLPISSFAELPGAWVFVEEIHSLHMLQHHSQRRNRFSSTSPNPDVLVWNEVGQYYDGGEAETCGDGPGTKCLDHQTTVRRVR